VYLHAWLPEIGPLENAAPVEEKFVSIARSALARNFKAAEQELVPLTTSESTGVRYLALQFQKDVLDRRIVLIGDGFLLRDETGLWMARHRGRLRSLEAEVNVLRETAASPAEKDRLALVAFAANSVIRTCVINVPTFDNGLPDGRISAGSSTVTNTIAGGLRRSCAANASGLRANPTGAVLSGPSQSLLESLIEARIAALVAHDKEMARAALSNGLGVASRMGWNCASASLMMLLGDVEATPSHGVLSLGFSPTAGGRARMHLNVTENVGMSWTAPAGLPLSLSAARSWYDRARATGQGCGELFAPASFDFRAAQLAFQTGSPEAGALFHNVATASRESKLPVFTAMALGAEAVLTGRGAPLREAFSAAAEQEDAGAMLSLAELAQTWSMLRKTAGDHIGAARLLFAVASSLEPYGLNQKRADLLSDLATVEARLRRLEKAVRWRDESVRARRAFLESVVNLPAQPKTSDDLIGAPDRADVQDEISKELTQLAQDLNALEVEDGAVVWNERRTAIEKEIRSLSGQAGLGAIESAVSQLNMSNYQTAAGLRMMRQMRDCGGVLREYASKQAQTARNAIASIEIKLMASDCDASLLAEAREELKRFDPPAEVRRGLAELAGAGEKYYSQLILLQVLLGRTSRLCLYADQAGAADLLSAWAGGLLEAVRANASMSRLEPEYRGYLVRALILGGKPAEARKEIQTVMHNRTFWTRATPDERGYVLDSLVEAEASSGRIVESLMAAEAAAGEQLRAFDWRSGIRPGDADSLELAMLVRNAASGENFNTHRLRELESMQYDSASEAEPPDSVAMRLTAALTAIPRRTTVLAYYPLRSQLLLWRIERDQPVRLHRIPIRASRILRLGKQLKEKLANYEMGWETLARELHNILIKPAGALTPGYTVAIAGADRLGGIPFDVLGPTRADLLVKSTPVIYIAGLTTRDRRSGRTSQKRALVVGVNGDALQFAESEAVQIAKLVGTAPLAGSQATVNSVRSSLPGVRWVHFATHGVINQQNPHLSHLSVTGGKLEAWQLSKDLSLAELVVLSACDTKRAAPYTVRATAPDVQSLTAVLLNGGTRRVVSTLWRASDDSAPAIMRAFYRQLVKTPNRPGYALAMAKRPVLDQEHPWSFALFALTVADVSALDE
jgi:CHAT domain-containing protein